MLAATDGNVTISVEVPVFKGRHLRACVASVLAQTSPDWTLTLVWDGGDAESLTYLQELEQSNDPRVAVYYTENQGISRARRYLTERTRAPYILPLDDDDVLSPRAVERFQQAAREKPWASLLRAQRCFIDEDGRPHHDGPLFPFAERTYFRGMVTDPYNQAQPYVIRRSAYERTEGWRGFADFMQAGEDCDIFLQLEEVGAIELVEEPLYFYRVHRSRASVDLSAEAGYEMWRRLLDRTIVRLKLPLRRTSDMPPFTFERTHTQPIESHEIAFVTNAHDGGVLSALRRDEFRAVCYLGASPGVGVHEFIADAVRAMNDGEADVIVPATDEPGTAGFARCLASTMLVRHEVVLSTGGLDEAFVPGSLLHHDLWMQSRRRDFVCQTVRCKELVCDAVQAWPTDDLAQLLRKWKQHAHLFREVFGVETWQRARQSLVASSQSGPQAVRRVSIDAGETAR